MAVPGIKFDDGTGGFATNCFPVRGLINQNEEEGGGAWLVAHKAEQRRRFKAVLCAKPKTYSQLREERKRASKETPHIEHPTPYNEDGDEEKVLDGFFLMKHCHVEDPSDLCSVNASGQGLADIKDEDFCLFDNVAYVNVSENILPLESFNSFPIIRELEMSLNCLRNLKINVGDFPHLEMLDLSYNNLSPDDLFPIGLLPQLRVLHLTGNYLKTLPNNLCMPHTFPDSFEEIPRFPNLEIFMLDDNKFSSVHIFAALAGLPRLHQLNLARNDLSVIPQLMLIDGRHVTQDISSAVNRSQKKVRSASGQNRSAKSRKSALSAGRKSILKNSPSLEEGPTNTPLLRRSCSVGSSERPGSQELGEAGAQDHGVKFKETQGEPVNDEEKLTVSEIDLKPIESTEDVDFGELNLNEIEDKIEEETFKGARVEAERRAVDGSSEVGLNARPARPPFPELCSLNLSYNQITDEDSLLAVAAWPMVSELIIHDNPLTTQNSGDPPLLKRYLGERFGISIIRKRPEGPMKPRIEVHSKPERRVHTVIPPVPRCNVDELLALEAPKLSDRSTGSDKTSLRSASSATPPAHGRLDRATPLPPISPTPSPPVEEAEEKLREGEEKEATKNTADRQKTESNADVFFMTQIEDTAQPRQTETQSPQPKPPAKPKDEIKQRKTKRKQKIPDKYKGFEALLDTADDVKDTNDAETPQIPQDLQSTVKSLQYTLDHPLMFRDKPLPLDKPQPPFRPLIKHPGKPPGGRKPRSAEIGDVLDNLRERTTLLEAGLSDVIKTESADKNKEFPDAQRLLTEMKRSYYSISDPEDLEGPSDSESV